MALQDKKVGQAEEIDIRTVIAFVVLKLGIREQNIPGDTEMTILVGHLREHYGGNTVAEIRLAFEMAIADKLDFGKDGSANPYESFSCLYVSKVMNAYRKWSSVTYQQEIKPPIPPALPGPKISEEEIIQTARGLYRTTKNPLYLAASLFKMLNLNPSEEDRTRIRKRAVEIVDKMYFEDKNLFHDISQEKYVNNTAKKLAVAEYFDKEENSKA